MRLVAHAPIKFSVGALAASGLVALPELLERRTMQEGRIPDPMRHLDPEILLLQKPGQRRSVGEIDAGVRVNYRLEKEGPFDPGEMILSGSIP